MSILTNEESRKKDFKNTYKMGEVVDIKTGKLNANQADPEGKYPFFTCDPETKSIDQYSFDTDAVLLAGNNASGKYSVRYFSGKFDAYQRTYVLESEDESILSNRYLKYILDTKLNYFQNISSGATTQFLTKSLLKNVELSLSTIEKQNRIVSILSTFDDLIENNKQRISILEEMAETIYQEWFVNFNFPGSEDVEMKNSELGGIPESFKVKKMKEIAEKIVLGQTPSTNKLENYGTYMPFIRIPDMRGNMFITDTKKNLSKKGVNTQNKRTIPENSISVSCIGTIGLVSIASEPSQTNQQINSIVLKRAEDREYLYFVLSNMKRLIQKKASGATFSNLNKTKFSKLNAPLPPMGLVDKFSRRVSPMFDLILTFHRRNKILQQMRDVLIPRLISGEIKV